MKERRGAIFSSVLGSEKLELGIFTVESSFDLVKYDRGGKGFKQRGRLSGLCGLNQGLVPEKIGDGPFTAQV